MKRTIVLLALVTIAVLGSARAALACLCSGDGPPCQAFWNTPFVFDAVALDTNPQTPFVTLDVRQVWKGTVPSRVTAMSFEGADEIACAFVFKPGRRYLVFGSIGPSGLMRVSLCSVTHEWDGTGPDADFLASLSRPAPGGRIVGSVWRFTRAGGGVPEEAMIPIVTSVHLKTPDGVRTVSSTGGEYRFDGLAPGEYDLTIDTPDDSVAYSVPRHVEIPSGHACSVQSFSVTDNGRIAGRLVDDRGNPVSGLPVEVVTAGNLPLPLGLSPRAVRTAGDGSFEAGELPSGDYVVGVNLIDLPDPGRPYARVLFSRGESNAGTVTVKAGERVDLGTRQLPSPAPTWVISGVVAWEDGSPAPTIAVRALDVTGGRASEYTAGRAVSGADGSFALTLWRGHRYRFVVTAMQTEPMLVAAPAVDVGNRPPSPIRIVLRMPK